MKTIFTILIAVTLVSCNRQTGQKPNYCIRVRNIMEGDDYLIEFRYSDNSKWVTINEVVDISHLSNKVNVYYKYMIFNNYSYHYIYSRYLPYGDLFLTAKEKAIKFASKFKTYNDCIVWNTRQYILYQKTLAKREAEFEKKKVDIETVYCR